MPLLFTMATAVQASGPVTTSRFYPIAGTALFFCDAPNPPPADPVVLSGQIHVVTRVPPFAPPITPGILIHANLVNVSGVGASGLTYRAVGAAKQFSPPSPITPILVPFHGVYDFVQEGACPPSNVNVRGVVEINPDGTQGPGSAFTFGEPTF
jgi:hypothetical protein